MKKYFMNTMSLIAVLNLVCFANMSAVCYKIKGEQMIILAEYPVAMSIKVLQNKSAPGAYDIEVGDVMQPLHILARISLAHTAAINSIAFSKDKTLLLTAGDDNYVRVWSILAGTKLEEFKQNKPCLSADFINDDREIHVETKDGCFDLKRKIITAK